MSFHNVRLPDEIQYGSAMGAGFNTITQFTASGHGVKIERQTQPRRRFRLVAALRSQQEAFALLTFAIARHGGAHSFRLKDWLEYSTAEDGYSTPTGTDQILGVGDGVRTSWPMVRTYDPFGPAPVVRKIALPVAGTFTATAAGSPASASISNPGGVVTFDTPPALGAVVMAGCEFDVPVFFNQQMDSWTSLRADAFDTWSMEQLECEEDLNSTDHPELWNYGGCKNHHTTAQSFAISYGEGLLHVVNPSGTINVTLPLPQYGGDRHFVFSIGGSSGSVQFRADDGTAIGPPVAAPALKRFYCSTLSDGTFQWLIGSG
jgi:uncharacterized protein (TIGR02217 family)